MRSDETQSAQRLRVVIVGGGTAGWMMAAGLSRLLPADQYDLTLIESDEIGTVGVGEATLPHIKQFNDRLGIDEVAFMRATGATIKLGIEFVGWNQPTDRYIHPFGAFGEPWVGVDFQHHWARARLAGLDVGSLQDYCYAIALCRAHAFELPSADPGSIRSSYSYAYHFDAGLYAGFLRDWAVPRGVRRIEGRIINIHRDGETGHVSHLTLKSGECVEGDFFVDCSGFRSLLVGGTLDVPWCDWRDWLPCDRALAVPSDRVEPLTPFTRATARQAGWTWRIPLQHRTGNGLVYASDHLSDDAAAAALLAAVEGQPLAEPRFLRFTTGRRRQAWNRNVVAIGLAAGFLEPLESTSLHLIQTGVTRLLALLPERGPDPLAQAEYNRITAEEYERIRDFLVLHYHANRRPEPFWQARAQTPPPERLQWKLDHFRQFGRVVSEGPELFANTAWTAVMIGQGVLPQSPEPLVRLRGDEDARRILPSLRRTIADTVAQCPEHLPWLEHIGALSARA